MKFLVTFAFICATICSLPANGMRSRGRNQNPAGRSKVSENNGHKAREGQFPYQVGLIIHYDDYTDGWCGGALITHNEVITAAHCTDAADGIEVLLGFINRDKPEVVHKVSKKNVAIHPRWSTVTGEYDISIIHIPHTQYSKTIQPVKLPTVGNSIPSLAGEMAISSGWGCDETSPHLRYSDFTVRPNKACGKLGKSTKICAVSVIDTCNGDSGGPLVTRNNNTLIGLASCWALTTCMGSTPIVFIRVSIYLNWIQQNINVAF